MKKKSELFKLLAEENQKISSALKAAGYETIKIDISQIRNAENGTVDIQIWARSEDKN
jgi:outer membrane protein assembly factor BamA